MTMSPTEYDRLDAHIRALFLIQAQSFSLTVSKAVGAGNESAVFQQYHAMALKYAKLWPERIREEGTKAIDGFFDLLVAGAAPSDPPNS
jgi:hypothetical protein